ncbi:Hypothetical protein GLP15_4501 [Giardia lamblia P15]|uniref:Uncharacterized protein n=1 Tax=Giardia intestinalis (strain P15) TaxID=658858 RepID=E1F9L6_GIAIA|nr:Hypothetical protein GLP15_4501 [Giardia lamblia P15]
MLFSHQNDTYRLHDRGTAISIDVLEGYSWIEIMYECIPAHQGEMLFVVSTKDLVLIISTKLTVSLTVQPRVCITELKEIMKPLGLCDLVDVKGISQYLVFLFRRDCNELRLVQTAYRLVEGQDVAMQLVDVCSMQGPTTDLSEQRRPFFIKLQVLPHAPSSITGIESPPPPPPPKGHSGRLKYVAPVHKTDMQDPPRPSEHDAAAVIYLIMDHFTYDDVPTPAFQVSLHKINLSPLGMMLSAQSTHPHSLPICNSVAITENSIILLAQDASTDHCTREYLHYSLQHDTLTEYPAPFFNAVDMQGSLLFLSGVFLLCPQSEVSTTAIIDFTKELLSLQIRDPSIKYIYPKDDTGRRNLFALQSKSQEEKKESLNTATKIYSEQLLDNTTDENIADLLLSPYYSPTSDTKNPSLRSYLLNTYGTNSILPPFSSELSFAHSVSEAVREDEEESVVGASINIPLETLLHQLVKKYTSDLGHHNHNSLGVAEDASHEEVYLEEVHLEVQALAKHTKDVMAHNQTRIQSLQTGVDNPYIALHDLMLSLSNDTYVWMQKQMFYFLLYFLPTTLLPEKEIIIHSYRKHRQSGDSKDSDELSILSMQLGAHFILNRWGKEVQRALIHIASVIASSKTNELEERDPNFLSSLHFVLAMLSNFSNTTDCCGKTKLTAPLECGESSSSLIQSVCGVTSNNLGVVPSRFPSDASYMQLFVYVTLLLGLFRKTIVAESRCYSVQGDQIRTASRLEQGVTYNLVFPAYASADNNKLFTEAVWTPFITQTEFSLPSLR